MVLVDKGLDGQDQLQATPTRIKVAVLTTFVANPLLSALDSALQTAGLSRDVWIGPHNQIVRECTEKDSQTARYRPDVLLVWPQLEDLWRNQPLPLTNAVDYEQQALSLAEGALAAAQSWNALLIFILPGIPETRPLGVGDACTMNGVFATATAVRESLRKRLAGQHSALILDSEEAIRAVGVPYAYDHERMAYEGVPFSDTLFSVIGEQATRLIRLNRQAARKVLVVDADNTLWGGVVGEDGPRGVEIGEKGRGRAYRNFQEFLLEMRRLGMLLALCSKNHADDVWNVFSRTEMQLKAEHFAAHRVGWNSKATSLREIADELRLGVDSFVFIDDSPAELAEIQTELPEVACIRMPGNPVEWLDTLQNTGVLDRLPPTPEDLQRTSHYEQERTRTQTQVQSASAGEYRAKLGIQARVFAPSETDYPRLGQLVAKTNQFNLNCRRRSEADLAALCRDEKYIVRLCHVQDRFGDYGTVGAFIVHLHEEQAELDTFVLSCRAMGRGVEEAMMAALFQVRAQLDAPVIVATAEEHPRNEPARHFFAQLGCNTIGVSSPITPTNWPPYIAQLT